jgi:hypothetical protein
VGGDSVGVFVGAGGSVGGGSSVGVSVGGGGEIASAMGSALVEQAVRAKLTITISPKNCHFFIVFLLGSER